MKPDEEAAPGQTRSSSSAADAAGNRPSGHALQRHELRLLAGQLLAGAIEMEAFVEEILRPRSVALSEITLDVDRSVRCGFPEVIYAEGKSVAALHEAIEYLVSRGQPVLCTRMDESKAALLCSSFPQAHYNPLARTFRIHGASQAAPGAAKVSLVTAGTSDLPVAEEARETLEWMGITPAVVKDVGVAGPHRLPERLEQLRSADCIVVVAGMEGALPSVVGGYVACPVIAVPTSVGYGASLGGIAALLGMLNSCAANVTVVNIDAGFKGAYVAGLIARRVEQARTAAAR